MRIITNEALIKRNARMGQIASIAGLALLVGGMIISFQNQEKIGLSLTALLTGFILSQVGIYLGNRYSRPPRADQVLAQALKGMDKRYTLYHYSSPISHLLIGPAGIWALFPHHQRGVITYEKGRWRQRGSVFLAYMKLFAQEGIGRPDLEMGADLEVLDKFIKKEIPDMDFPPAQAVLIFTNPDADLQAQNAPIPTLPVRKLKDFIRKQAKGKQNRLSLDKIRAMQIAIEGADEEDEWEDE